MNFSAAGQLRLDAVSAAGVCLPETRVWGSRAETGARIGAVGWVSSTLRWGWTPGYDGTAVGSLVQRYYATGAGRFMSADPYKASAGASDPGSWNRYAYVEGDPINKRDRAGLFSEEAWDDDRLFTRIFLTPAPIPAAGPDPADNWPLYVFLSRLSSPFSYDCVTWECEQVQVTLTEQAYDLLLVNGLQATVAPPQVRGGNFVVVLGGLVFAKLVEYYNASKNEQETINAAFRAALAECKREGKRVPERKKDLDDARDELGLSIEAYKLKAAEKLQGNSDTVDYKTIKNLAKEILCGDA